MPATTGPTDSPRIVSRVLAWYDVHARDLPWRRPEATPWQIMISEVMLQQTPVARVVDPWREWTQRWPTPAALAATSPGEAVRAWGRLGYPRRAVRLHAAATTIVQRHGGRVPTRQAELLDLPGVGAYTAAAVASFAFGQRHVVLDTNVRRLLARCVRGMAGPTATPTAAEQALARDFLPRSGRRAARWAVASMELGALVCSARVPRCDRCPLADRCAWRRAGRPAGADLRVPRQRYEGTDRQCRGRILARLRAGEHPVPLEVLNLAWPDSEQRDRALRSLLADGLVEVVDGRLGLPTRLPAPTRSMTKETR